MESHHKLNGQSGSNKISCLQAKPLDDPIWRGILVITNERFGSTYGIEAHLSSNACGKVCQVAQLFPALLYSEVVPRLDIWPTRFTRLPPTDNDIALYFFAEKRGDELFENLLSDLSGRNVALKVLIDKAELLIFTSSQLPEQHQKIEGKSYMWGVFRRNKAPTSCHLINKTKCIMPLSAINALSSVISEERALIKTANNESGTSSIHHVESSVKDDNTRVDHSINADRTLVESSINDDNTSVESFVNTDNALVEYYINADHPQDEDVTKPDTRKNNCDEEEVEATVNVEPYLIACHTHAESSVRDDQSSVNADNALVESFINADHAQDGDVTKTSDTQETDSELMSKESGNCSIHHEESRKSDCDEQEVEATVEVESSVNVESFNADHTQDDNVTENGENQEKGSTALERNGSDPNHSRNTVNPVHSSPMINTLEEALTHDPMPTNVPTSISPAISTTIISETSLSRFQEISGTPSFQQPEVKSDMNANHTQDDNALVEFSINALVESTTNALVESSTNADDNALVDSFINADHTQDEDVIKNGDNQEMDSTAFVSKGSDPNHSRNTVNPVHSSPMIDSPEEALTHNPTPTVGPTSISPAICTTIISETSLSQFQEISGTPTFQQREAEGDCSNNTTQTFTANLADMGIIFKGVDSQEASTHSVRVNVGKYTINQSLSSILESILDKHGDIAQRCQLSDESTSYILELICKVFKNLQQLSLNKLRSRHLKYLKTILTEARSVNIDVDWLKSRHDKLEEIIGFASLKDATYKKIKAAESNKRTLELKKAELVKTESEWESMENQLTSLEAEFQSMEADISNMASEITQFMEKPLNDGLL